MLVYLDSAHLALLETATPDARAGFFAAWDDAGCELALSFHHLQEIAQVANVASINRRFEALSAFKSIRSKPATAELALRLETQVAAIQLLGHTVDTRRSGITTLFPPADLEELRTTTVALQPIFHLMREAYALGAEAENLAKEASLNSPTSSIRRPIQAHELGSADVTGLEEALESADPAVAGFMRSLSRYVREKILKHRTVRKALEKIYGLQHLDVRSRIRDSDLPPVSVFFKSAAPAVQEALLRVGRSTLETEAVKRQLNPYAIPGFALQLAVRRGRSLHPKPDKPSDQLDLDHVAFAPFVDLHFVDKRTYGFVLQARRDVDSYLPPNAMGNVRQAGTLERVAEAIRQYKGT